MAKFRFLSEISKGVAFEAFGKTERELLQNSALALCEAMVDIKTVRSRESSPVNIREANLTTLLFNLLEHLIFLKNAKQLLIRDIKLGVERKGKIWSLQGFAYGERINEAKHKLKINVRGVSADLFKVEKLNNNFRAQVILEH
ncbi:archease [Candidatus Microgenomates bacterium]|nr:archease [Candidatus Microgenomates bacterium]